MGPIFIVAVQQNLKVGSILTAAIEIKWKHQANKTGLFKWANWSEDGHTCTQQQP